MLEDDDDDEANEAYQTDKQPHHPKSDTVEPQKGGSDGKLILAEEIKHGHVTWRSINLLISGMGGDHPVLFFAVMTAGFMLMAGNNVLQVWFLGFWAEQYEKRPPSDVSAPLYVDMSRLLGLILKIHWMCFSVTCSLLLS